VRRFIACITAVLFVLTAVLTPIPVLAQDAGHKTVLSGLLHPQRFVIADNGDIYILDGMVMKKYSNGQLTTVASLPASRQYFEPYGLGELEDIYTFRPGGMVYNNGAIYLSGVMIDRYLPPKTVTDFYFPSRVHHIEVGNLVTVYLKVTDHFEPILVEDRKPRQHLDMSVEEYKQLSISDPDYVNHIRLPRLPAHI